MSVASQEARFMANTANPKLEKMANGLYTVRDYQPPRNVNTKDLRKLADEARKVTIHISYDNPRKPEEV
jgi:hypothetical protein